MKSDKKQLRNLLKFVGDKEPIKSVSQGGFYNDEPKIFFFSASLNNKNDLNEKYGGGSSFIKEKALIKTLGEALERYSLNDYNNISLIWSDYFNFKKSNRILDPSKIVTYSGNRKNKEMNWTRAHSLFNSKKYFIPSQLIFVPYFFDRNEFLIRQPITTGAACSSALKGAILRGLLEVVERDAFMITYLNRLPRSLIDLNSIKENISLTTIIDKIRRYNLEVYLIDISSDVPVYCILTILVDRTGLGPAVSVGVKAALDINVAMIGSIEESVQTRLFVRNKMIREKTKNFSSIKKNKYYIRTPEDRGILWSDINMIKRVDFLFQGNKKSYKNLPKFKSKNLKEVVQYFKEKQENIFSIDITSPPIKKKGGVKVAKVIIPSFHPVYLDENFSCIESERVRNIPQKIGYSPAEKLNHFPHPFL